MRNQQSAVPITELFVPAEERYVEFQRIELMICLIFNILAEDRAFDSV